MPVRILALLLTAGCVSAAPGSTVASPERAVLANQSTPGGPQEGPPPGSAWLIFGNDTVVAEVAWTGDQRARGLMERESIPDGTGMLFIFEEPSERSFWMRNTPVSLDLVFFDENYTIVGIEQMEAETSELHDSPGPVSAALEVRQGWFAEKDIGVGDSAEVIIGPRDG